MGKMIRHNNTTSATDKQILNSVLVDTNKGINLVLIYTHKRVELRYDFLTLRSLQCLGSEVSEIKNKKWNEKLKE
jgi:hypothetical protein